MTVVERGYGAATSAAPTVRKIGIADVKAALAEGYQDFLTLRGDILFIGLIYPVVGLIACAVALNLDLVPIVFPLAAGLTLLGPAVATGFYELSKRRQRGEDATWRHFFDVLKNPSFKWLAVLTVALAILFVAWLASAWFIYGVTLGIQPYVPASEFLNRLFTTPEGWVLIVAGNLAGLAFAVVVLAVSVVSFPLLVDRKVDLLTAVETSVRAVVRNPGPMAAWGVIVAALLVLGSIPLFVGLAIVLPWLGYATWRLYTKVVS